MLRGVLRSAALRQAALELERLPEFVEARQAYARADPRAALRQLERVSDVMQYVPEYGMQVVAKGALAQALREAGLLAREAKVWGSLLTHGADLSVRVHVLNSATACALHSGRVKDALTYCDEGQSMCKVLPGADRWKTVFCVHRALALTDSPSAATEQLQGLIASCDLNKDPVDPATATVADSARLLLGDQLVALGREDEAKELWQHGIQSEEDLRASEGGQMPEERVLIVSALRSRLGRLELAGGHVVEAMEQHKAALNLCEVHLRSDHPALFNSIAELAVCFGSNDEPVIAEGLYRTAIDALRGGAGGLPSTLTNARLAVKVMTRFAGLLDQLEWNNARRTSEAQALRDEACGIQDKYREAFSGLKRESSQTMEWWPMVPEPWLDISLCDDWLTHDSN